MGPFMQHEIDHVRSAGVIMGGATGVGIVLGKVIPLDTAGIVLGVNLMALVR